MFQTDLSTGVTFRAKTSFIEYHFNKTSAFPGVNFTLQFSSTSCKGDLILVTSRDTDNFFKIVLENEVISTFYYKLGDRHFSVQATLPVNKTFCDGQKHVIQFKLYGRMIRYSADGGQELKIEDTKVNKATFSKPDKIVLGGISSNKFDGCVYSASVFFHWKKYPIRNVKVNILERYLNRDPRVSSAAVFVGACPESEATDVHKIQGMLKIPVHATHAAKQTIFKLVRSHNMIKRKCCHILQS